MKKLLLMLVPLVLSAQVQVDTVMRLPERMGQAFFVPEFNKLYVMPRGNAGSYLYVLDCSTYALKTKIYFGPVPAGALTRFSWSPLRKKLYVTSTSPLDSTLVIDVTADTIAGWLKVYHDWRNDVYLSDIDARFKPSVDTLYEYDCANDSIIRRLPIRCTCASWDSVGKKLYVGQGSRRKLYVYDYLADSCLKVIDISAVEASYPDACVFSSTYRRAYVSSFQFEMMGGDYVGIIDTDRDTLLRVLPVRVTEGLYRQVAVDDQDGKVYIADCDDYPETPDTMWVVDCATDSVVKKFECVPAGHTDACIRWVPWSNRIYLVNIFPDVNHNSALVVIDCATDSIIVPGMLATGDFIRDIQLDPIRQRIFVVGADSYCVYVLRDVEAGVAEEPVPRPAASATARICPSSGGVAVEYQLSAAARVRASLHDAVGRRIGMLDAGEQKAGLHQLSWNRDQEGRRLSAGAYFIHLDLGAEQARLKAVVR